MLESGARKGPLLVPLPELLSAGFHGESCPRFARAGAQAVLMEALDARATCGVDGDLGSLAVGTPPSDLGAAPGMTATLTATALDIGRQERTG
jgi:hypothetical protein